MSSKNKIFIITPITKYKVVGIDIEFDSEDEARNYLEIVYCKKEVK